MVTSHPPKPTPRLSQQSTRVVLICSLDEPKHREPCRVCRVLWSSSGQGHVGEVVESLKNEGPLETNDTLIYSYMDPYVCWELEPYRFYLAIHVNGNVDIIFLWRTTSNVRTKMHVFGSDAWEASGQNCLPLVSLLKLDSPGQLGIRLDLFQWFRIYAGLFCI